MEDPRELAEDARQIAEEAIQRCTHSAAACFTCVVEVALEHQAQREEGLERLLVDVLCDG